MKVLLPPGSWDCYWSIVKMESFLRLNGITTPVDVCTVGAIDLVHESHLRAFPFIGMFPFMRPLNVYQLPDPAGAPFEEAYGSHGSVGRSIFQDVLGCDYFISYNGRMDAGYSLEECDREYECNWFPERIVSPEEAEALTEASKLGPYVVIHFPSYGLFQSWEEQFPVASIVSFINSISRWAQPVVAGAAWDGDPEMDPKMAEVLTLCPSIVNKLGKTTMPQLFGLLRGASAVIGMPTGLAFAAAYLGTKTIVLSNDRAYFHPLFYLNAVPPCCVGANYRVREVSRVTPDSLEGELREWYGLAG